MSVSETFSFSALFGVSRENADIAGIAVNAVKAGYAVLPVYPNTKRPMCTLTATARARADKAISAAAKEAGHRGWQNQRHSNSGSCGLHHAITDEKEAGRVFKRLVAEHPDLNLAIEVGRSRLLTVDADNLADVESFGKLWARESDNPGLEFVQPTVSSPGVVKVDQDGVSTAVHKNGGHFHFRLPDGVDFTDASTSVGLNLDGAVVYFKDRVLLVPPSVREEGPYTLNSDVGEAPEWLIESVRRHIDGRAVRATLQREKVAIENDPIDMWSSQVTWAELLEPDGWTSTHKFDSCGCEIWSRPGEWSNPKSAVAHDPGCLRWEAEGHGFLHLYTDEIPPFLQDNRNVSKLQYVALRDHEGSIKEAMGALDLAPNVDRSPLGDLIAPSSTAVEGLTDSFEDLLTREQPEAGEEFEFPEVDWHAAFQDQPDDIPWIIEPLFEEGRYYSLFSREKVGKSLLCLELVAAIASGKAVVGNPPREPVDVVYLDFENTTEDLVERLEDMDYTPDDLSRLHYLSFPSMYSLDVPRGAAQLLAIVKHYNARMVFIDTTSRVIDGNENDADPFNAMYRMAFTRLKSQGVAIVRLDHSGKEAARGQRGSSAKGTAEDVLWELTEVVKDVEFKLTKTRTRNNHGPTALTLYRRLDPLRHEIDEGDVGEAVAGFVDDEVERVVRLLDTHDVPVDCGERRMKRLLKDRGAAPGNSDRLRKAQKVRRERSGLDANVSPGRPKNVT